MIVDNNISNEILRKLQLTQIEILDEIVRVCDSLGLTYYLAYGTLLGAIRHKGFIPWDDDLDIWMNRKDYQIFAQYAASVMDVGFEFVDVKSCKQYGLPFGKVIKKGTIYKERNAPVNMRNGIFVDIFPLDDIGNDSKTIRKYSKRLYLCKRLLLAKTKYNVGGGLLKRAIYAILRALSVFISKNRLVQIIDKCIAKFGEASDKTLMVCPAGVDINTDSKKYEAAWFGAGKAIEFEGKKYNAPLRDDLVLSMDYGDYMQLPPEEKQYGHHEVIELSFGDER